MSRYHQATSHPPAASLLATEEHRMRKVYLTKKTLANLIDSGVLDSLPSEDPKTKKRKKPAGLKDDIHESGHLKLDDKKSLAPSTGAVKRSGRAKLDSQSSSAWSKLKELHDDEMFAARGIRSRERTFMGHTCAACEEPLEHMLRGERFMQLSCGHVSHQACFYEYIKEFEVQTCPRCTKPLGLDTSRGGNLDFDHLNKLVRNVHSPERRAHPKNLRSIPSSPSSPSSKEGQNSPISDGVSQQSPSNRSLRDHLLPERVQRSSQRHTHVYEQHLDFPGSDRTGKSPTIPRDGHAEVHNNGERRHEFDLHSMEASVNRSRHASMNPAPVPTVTIRSEFPTLNKSHQQQSLTCLVTIEVTEGNLHTQREDIRNSLPSASSIPAKHFEPPQSPSPHSRKPQRSVRDAKEDMALNETKEDLFRRVENWHGLDVERFGRLILTGTMHVGKDRQTWQELQCYLFSEMLVCVKERKSSTPTRSTPRMRCALKGSILVTRHLRLIECSPEEDVLTLHLTVPELPSFHLRFPNRHQLERWQRALNNLHTPESPLSHQQPHVESDQDTSGTDDDERAARYGQGLPSVSSSPPGTAPSQITSPTEYTASRADMKALSLNASSHHVPMDLVVVVPVSSSIHGLKMKLLRDSLRFLISSLGDGDRMGLVTFGSGTRAVPLVGMTTKHWDGWDGALDLIRPINQRYGRADVVDGTNVALDLLMQRKSFNTLSHILLISDSLQSDPESVEFAVSRAEAAKVSIYSFGLGLTHKPDTMVRLSARTKSSYTYVKDWMMLRECLAGCLGTLQSISHQNAKLLLRLPEDSPATIVKISGALHFTKHATGRSAEAWVGDLCFGDKRDILVQLTVDAGSSSLESLPSDPWENMISGLKAIGPSDQEDGTIPSFEELPLLQANLAWSDVRSHGSTSRLPQPSLFAISLLPSSRSKSSHGGPPTPPIPPHPLVVQRRMELLTADMLARALALASRGQNDRAQHLLVETRSLLMGLGKGSLPPLPPTPLTTAALPPTPGPEDHPKLPHESGFPSPPPQGGGNNPSPAASVERLRLFSPAVGIDKGMIDALDTELESSLEWIGHPNVFRRDSRKAVLQSINVITAQRGFTFRTPAEALWANRLPGVARLMEKSREWRSAANESLEEET